MINCMSIANLKKQVINLVKSSFDEFNIIDEFSKNQFFGLCKKNSICIKLKEIKTVDTTFGDYIDYSNVDGVSNQIFGKQVNIKFEFLIYTNMNEDLDLSEIFFNICDLLSENQDALFNQFVFSQTKFIENIQMFCTSVYANCSTIVTSIKENNLISDIVVSYKK